MNIQDIEQYLSPRMVPDGCILTYGQALERERETRTRGAHP